MSILYGKIRINGDAGQTITITTTTGQSRTIQTTGQSYTDVMLAGLEEYTLSNGILSETVLLNIGDFQEINLPALTLETATWQQVQEFIQAGNFSQLASIGDTKTFQINNKTYTAEVVAINDGTGDASTWYPDKTVDFITKELYETTYRYNATNTNTGGFTSSEVRNTLNGTIYPLLPSDLKSVITAKSHSYQAGSYSSNTWHSSMVTSTDNLWLPTRYEIAGTAETYAPGETSSNNKAYTLASKIKNIVDGSANNWWLGSPDSSNNGRVWDVTSPGSFYTDLASTALGLPLCFRIG